MKRTIILIMVLCFILCGCGSVDPKPTATVPAETPATTLATEPPEATAAPTEAEAINFSMSDVVSVLEESLKQNYDSVSITYEGNTIDINLSYPGLASAAQGVKSSNDAKQLESWNSLVSSLKKINSSALAVANDAGFSDATVILNFRNDLNPENILVIIMNGTVIYDVVNS